MKCTHNCLVLAISFALLAACGESGSDATLGAPAVEALPAGAACPHGGSRLTFSDGTSFVVCHGAPGQPGAEGEPGAAGAAGQPGAAGVSPTVSTEAVPPDPNGPCGASGGHEVVVHGEGDELRFLICNGDRGEDGESGPAGEPGETGAPGANAPTYVFDASRFAPGAHPSLCGDAAGIELRVIAADEEEAFFVLCDGAVGAPGSDAPAPQWGVARFGPGDEVAQCGQRGGLRITLVQGDGRSEVQVLCDGADGRDGEDGQDGQDGRDGVDGQDGFAPRIRTVAFGPEDGDNRCEGRGGVRIEIDRGEGYLPEATLCDGAAGADGQSAWLESSPIEEGDARCSEAGGVRFVYGVGEDIGGDVLVCNGVSPSAPEVRLSPVDPGDARCEGRGGVALSLWLADEEQGLPTLVCNGMDGRSVRLEVNTITEGDERCPTGGYQWQAWTEGEEPTQLTLCNGQAGRDGETPVVSAEPAPLTRCPTGGTTLSVGSEVVFDVCNGEDGSSPEVYLRNASPEDCEGEGLILVVIRSTPSGPIADESLICDGEWTPYLTSCILRGPVRMETMEEGEGFEVVVEIRVPAFSGSTGAGLPDGVSVEAWGAQADVAPDPRRPFGGFVQTLVLAESAVDAGLVSSTFRGRMAGWPRGELWFAARTTVDGGSRWTWCGLQGPLGNSLPTELGRVSFARTPLRLGTPLVAWLFPSATTEPTIGAGQLRHSSGGAGSFPQGPGDGLSWSFTGWGGATLQPDTPWYGLVVEGPLEVEALRASLRPSPTGPRNIRIEARSLAPGQEWSQGNLLRALDVARDLPTIEFTELVIDLRSAFLEPVAVPADATLHMRMFGWGATSSAGTLRIADIALLPF